MREYRFISIALVAAFVIVITVAFADARSSSSRQTDKNVPVNPHSIIKAIEGLESTVEQACTGACEDTLEVEIFTNHTVCLDLTAQCADNGSGHTPDIAAEGNHNPVAVYIHVTRNGVPVENLPDENIEFIKKFTPARAPGYGMCISSDSVLGNEAHCGPYADSLRQYAYDGVYSFYVHPIIVGFNWYEGVYTFMVRVTDIDGVMGSALGQIKIGN